MTTVRRINVSQIEGENANINDPNEIRPFGETAFYLDTDQNPAALTLMMFEGIRTHRRSKILRPGVFYGSNEDSSDGLGYDTIKLIPDAALDYDSEYTNDQYVIIEPTEGDPGHIHIRSGGTIDDSSADLFIGGEQTHVKVSDTSDAVVIRTSITGEGVTPLTWTFDNTGNLTFPDGTTTSGDTVISTSSYNIQSIGDTLIQTSANAGAKTWTFGADGLMSFPNNSLIIGHGMMGDTIESTDALVMNGEGGIILSSAPDGATLSQINLDVQGNMKIRSVTSGGGEKFWEFGANGAITVSDAFTIKTPTGIPTGAVTKISNNQGWDENNVGINLPTTGGTGTGLTVDVADGGSFYSNITINNPGTGYTDGDELTVTRPDTSETFTVSVPNNTWEFGTDGGLSFPDTTVQTTAYIPANNVTKSFGIWTVTPGDATYSFQVPVNGVYQLWVRGNIPDGIISYTATAAVTNSNVPVLGTQYAWNYTGAGNPILFTSLPTQFIGTEGTISTATPNVGTSTNTFVFGIDNNTEENVTIEWGYTKIS